ncbi:MAG: accessory gene regulator ArgB-like protein [Paraclostridium sp.]
MIKSISNRITSFLVCNKSIENEDSEVCSYGLEILISSLINLVVVLILGVIFRKFIQTVVFVICYCSIRQYSGGYHANTHIKCIFTFLCMYLVTVFVSGEIDSVYLKSIVVLIGALNWLNIYLLVPVEHINNPLSDFEKDKNKKNARIISTLILICMLIGASIGYTYEYIIYGVLALCWVNFMLILQIVKNRGDN